MKQPSSVNLAHDKKRLKHTNIFLKKNSLKTKISKKIIWNIWAVMDHKK